MIRSSVSYKDSSDKGISLVNNNGRMLTVPQEISSAFNLYFANVSKTLSKIYINRFYLNVCKPDDMVLRSKMAILKQVF